MMFGVQESNQLYPQNLLSLSMDVMRWRKDFIAVPTSSIRSCLKPGILMQILVINTYVKLGEHTPRGSTRSLMDIYSYSESDITNNSDSHRNIS